MSVDVHRELVLQGPPHPVPEAQRHSSDMLAVDVVLSRAGPALVFPESIAGATTEEGFDPRLGRDVGGMKRLADRAFHHPRAGRAAALPEVVS